MNVTTTIEVTTVTAGAIAITAMEGGIGYWAQADAYKWESWDRIEVPEDFVFYTIVDFEDVDEDDLLRALLPIRITPLVIRDGIERFLNGVKGNAFGSGFEGRQFEDMSDLECMDSAEADCVIQLGALGTLVFG